MPIKVKSEKYKSLLQSANTVFSVVKQHLINFIPIKYRLKCNFQEPPTIFLFNMKSVSSAMTWALIATWRSAVQDELARHRLEPEFPECLVSDSK